MSAKAVDILKKRLGDSPERRQEIDQEKERFSAACIIYDARTKAGLTQRELAKKVGTKQSVISRLESADYDGHTLGMLLKIAKALKMKLHLSLEPIDTPTVKTAVKPRIARSRRRRHSSQSAVACTI
jgi:ribosome-binding protein aMBF1 (putative translation factor)